MKKQFAALKNKISIQSSSQLTDYQFNSNGSELAVSDSDGNVYIFHKIGDGFIKSAQFNADDASIWKVSWSHPKFGKTIAVASFKKKVAIFQQRNNQWIEVAYHNDHEGSANTLCWAPVSYGFKLFAGGSDGKVSILELQGNGWKVSSFQAHQWSINSMAIEDLPLNQQDSNSQNQYPRIATASKDLSVKIWARQNKQSKYEMISSYTPHKQMIRNILWRPIWSKQNEGDFFDIISCSEVIFYFKLQDGSVKIITFNGQKGFSKQLTLLDQQFPVSRISQSLTGNTIIISTAGGSGNQQLRTYVLEESQKGKWERIQSYNQI